MYEFFIYEGGPPHAMIDLERIMRIRITYEDPDPVFRLDPDPAFHFDADRDLPSHKFNHRREHLHGSIASLHGSM